MTLWSADALRTALDLPAEQQVPDVAGVAIDSRTLRPGELFFALTGTADPRYHGAAGSGRDGHDFVADAARRGAAAAVVSHTTGADLPELIVPDPFAALWQLARSGRRRCKGPVFALTGSSGKTTAKAMLQRAIGGSHAAEGSFNNHLGVPLSLCRLPAGANAGIFEIGMNSPGEIQPLAELVAADVALVLNVLPVHLEGLGSLVAIRREKLSIAAGLGPDGTLVVPDELAADDGGLPAVAHLLTFGRSQAADIRLLDAVSPAAIVLPDGRRVNLQLHADGPHRRMTACAVAACLHAGGFDVDAGISQLQHLQPPAGRGGTLDAGGVTLIDDSYNANPESVRLALRGLRERSGGRKFALLGDMLELGVESDAMHADLASECMELDGLFCVGEHARVLYDAVPEVVRAGWWPNCETMDCTAVVEHLKSGDVLLVKASNRLFWAHGSVRALAVSLGMRTLESD